MPFARIVSSLVLFSFVLFQGCTAKSDIPLEFPTPPLPPRAIPLREFDLKRDGALESRIAEIARDARGTVGVAAVVIETGEAAQVNGGDRYPMQSVYKLPIAMAVMDQVRLGRLDLEEKIGVTTQDFVRAGMRSPLRDKNPGGGEFTIRELIRLSLVESDGTASDVLMRVAGGAFEIQSYLTQIGVRDMQVVNTEKEIGRDWQTQFDNWATPLASIELLRWLDADAKGWNPSNTDQELSGSQVLLRDMFQSVPGEYRIKGLLPLQNSAGAVAHKTGTGGVRDGINSATNDIGLVYMPNGRRMAIAVYVSNSPLDDRGREAVIGRIAKVVWDKWSK